MKAIILSCSTGGGHDAAGRAVKEELETVSEREKMTENQRKFINKNAAADICSLAEKLIS